MNFSIPYVTKDYNRKHFPDSEINITYHEDSTPEQLKVFAQEFADRRINVLFLHHEIEEMFSIVSKTGMKNIVVVIPFKYQLFNTVNLLSNYDYYTFEVAQTIYDVWTLINYGVSDIFLGEELLHNLDEIKDICYNCGVKIRLLGDAVPRTCAEEKEDPNVFMASTKFVPRPEDYDLLCEYFDVIQFLSETSNMLNVLEKVWTAKTWFGDISGIMAHDIPIDFPNLHIPKGFTESKLNCKVKCLYGKSTCRKCMNSIDIARMLEEKMK